MPNGRVRTFEPQVGYNDNKNEQPETGNKSNLKHRLMSHKSDFLWLAGVSQETKKGEKERERQRDSERPIETYRDL